MSARSRDGGTRATSIERASPDDLVALATDVGAAPMQVGAVLVLGADLDPGAVRRTIAERIRRVPRLRQRLVSTPLGCGRPVWVDDAIFNIDRHVRTIACPDPGDEEALLEVAARVINTRLPRHRPLWSMTLVTGLRHDRCALVVTFHHVLADGIGGLAVLAALVDGPTDGVPPHPEPVQPQPDPNFPRLAPTAATLALDALRGRLVALGQIGDSSRRVRDALTQLRPVSRTRAVHCSLNRPTGPDRRYAVVRVALDDVRRVAHIHGGTVNDVVLTAVADALRTLLAARGEAVDRFVVSVPVSARRQASVTDLGNEVGVVPIEAPATGDLVQCLGVIATATGEAKRTARAASTAVLGPVFRMLARIGLFGWYTNRQRRVHTFVTNVRGPDERLAMFGAPLAEVIPAGVITGNVTAAFAVLSHGGDLVVTIVADPDAMEDLPVLQAAVQDALDRLVGSTPT